MAKNRDNARIYGGDNDAVWCAAKGSTPPTGLGAPTTPWEEVGWLDEDGGIEANREAETKLFRGHQGGKIVRTKKGSPTNTFKFTALEETKLVLGLVYGDITWVTASAVATGTPTGTNTSDERAWIVDTHDETSNPAVHTRKVWPVGTAEITAAYKAHNSEMTMYEITVTCYEDPIIVSNNPALATA